MNNASVFNSIKKSCSAYRSILETVPAARFTLTPPIGGWSYSEVYSHIFEASLLSLVPMEACIAGNGKEKKTAFVVKVILFFGQFPPAMKFKVPKELESGIKKISPVEAVSYIDRFLQQLEADYKNMAPPLSKLKTRHPRLGYLSASQWLRFIEIHLNHHLKQLKRIEKSF